MRDPITEFNTLLIAADEPPSAEKLEAAMRGRRPGRAAGARGDRRAARAVAAGRQVFTDDKAPVEWLIDRSIVAYAAGEE